MATTFEKKALLTGIGNGFFQVMFMMRKYLKYRHWIN